MQTSRREAAEGAERSKRDSKEVRIGRTNVGLGVFARRHYRKGEIVGEIEGTVIEDENYGSDYCMCLGDTSCLEPSAPFRFMNHSCEPNCRFDWFDITTADEPRSRRRVFVLVRIPIRPGDELTIDYGWPAHMAIRCRCGSEYCRGWVVAADELPLVPK